MECGGLEYALAVRYMEYWRWVADVDSPSSSDSCIMAVGRRNTIGEITESAAGTRPNRFEVRIVCLDELAA